MFHLRSGAREGRTPGCALDARNAAYLTHWPWRKTTPGIRQGGGPAAGTIDRKEGSSNSSDSLTGGFGQKCNGESVRGNGSRNVHRAGARKSCLSFRVSRNSIRGPGAGAGGSGELSWFRHPVRWIVKVGSERFRVLDRDGR